MTGNHKHAAEIPMAPCVLTTSVVDLRNAAVGSAHRALAHALSQEPAVSQGSVFLLAFNAHSRLIEVREPASTRPCTVDAR